MRVLVTGGAGFLGGHLVDALVAAGEEVVVLDNLNQGSRASIDPHLCARAVRFIEADIRDYAAVHEAVAGAEVVYHLAAQSNVIGAITDTDYSFTTNVAGTYNVLKATASTRVRRLVFSSSREVYGEPESVPVPESSPLSAKNTYGASKVAGEAYCQVWELATGLECQILRFANIYGPRDRDRVIPIWIERAHRGEPLELFGGDQLIDFVWVGTAVEALLSAAGAELTGPINIGSGAGVTLHHLAQRVLEETGSASQLKVCPCREIEVVRFIADVERMRRVLGVTPDADPLAHLGACFEEGACPIPRSKSRQSSPDIVAPRLYSGRPITIDQAAWRTDSFA